jgi:L-glyceraldehyde reductase
VPRFRTRLASWITISANASYIPFQRQTDDDESSYGNQKEIAQAFKKAFGGEVPNLKREDVFITSKLWNSQHRPEHVADALDDCLAELGLDYLDLYLVHFPVAFDETKDPNNQLFPLDESSSHSDKDVKMYDGVSIVDTWKAMTQLDKKKARAVGVSNHTKEHLQALIDGTGVTPAANQIERHPRLLQPELIKYCAEKNIHITAYSVSLSHLDSPTISIDQTTHIVTGIRQQHGR